MTAGQLKRKMEFMFWEWKMSRNDLERFISMKIRLFKPYADFLSCIENYLINFQKLSGVITWNVLLG
jgi:hypothetical protein